VTREVAYAARAQHHLADLYDWIADVGYPDRAERYISAILDFCDSLAGIPFVGQARDDIRPGMRTTGFRRRVTIAFAVTDTTVEILGIYYGGRDYESLLDRDPD